MAGLTIAFFGSGLLSSCRSSAASYYRGLIRNLYKLGHRITFYEPDTGGRKPHRDMPAPDWVKIAQYPADEDGVCSALEKAQQCDLIIKTAGAGPFDELLEREILLMKREKNQIVFWDSDAAATLRRIRERPDDPFKSLIPRYDLILTNDGGAQTIMDYRSLGAAACIPFYNALDTELHFPVSSDHRLIADLSFLGNRVPGHDKRINDYFFSVAEHLPEKKFLLAGSGWSAKKRSGNVEYLGQLDAAGYNTFNCSATAVLNVGEDSMNGNGFSPSTRVLAAAGAGSCIISDTWEGMEHFFEPGKELFVAVSGTEIAEIVKSLTPGAAAVIGTRALARARAEHTYEHRARQFEKLFGIGERKKCKPEFVARPPLHLSGTPEVRRSSKPNLFGERHVAQRICFGADNG